VRSAVYKNGLSIIARTTSVGFEVFTAVALKCEVYKDGMFIIAGISSSDLRSSRQWF
jgi:hypothetical protein